MGKPAESEKKKLIRIGCTHNTRESYEYTNITFTFVSSPENGRMQCTKLMSCRENLNKAISTSITTGDTGSKEQIDFEKLRLLIVKSVKDNYDDFKMKLFSGKALLNRYEEKAGWETSKITTVKHECHKNAWLLTGPKEWMSQPQLLSIATIFMRIMSVHGPLEVDTFEEAEDSLKKLHADYIKAKNSLKEGGSFTYYPDVDGYLKHLNEIRIMMTNSEEIFADIGLEKAWADTNKDTSFGVQSGLLSFLNITKLNYNDSVPIVQNRFAKLKKKLNRKE